MLDGYTVVNLAASYQWNDRWQWYGRIENLFDERYEDVLGDSGTERGLYLGARYRF